MDSVEKIWNDLGDIPANDDGYLQERFLHFPKGTHREDVWQWIEREFDVSVNDLMFPPSKDMSKLTEKQYVKKGGTVCPFCGSDQTEGHSIDVVEPGHIEQEMTCSDCEKAWYDHYYLTGFTEIEED